nr:ATP-binding protein [Bacteroidota bacterium]
MELLETIKEIILDNQESFLFTGSRRHTEMLNVTGKASICVGVRRCGKSTLLNQKIEEIKSGYNKENVLCINFFDDRLSELRNGNLQLIFDAYFALYPQHKGNKIFCFFDELQECNNWEPFVDRILRTENADVYITGSSAKLLSREIATQMRGRSISVELFPFSFAEYLDFHSIDYIKMTSETRYNLEHWFDKYFETGGYPEVVTLDKKTRIKIHQEYYKTILHRDIIERFDSLHPKATIQIAYRLMASVSSLYSINRITEYMKSLGYKLSKDFVSDCIDWMEDAYFLFSVKKFDRSLSKQNLNAKKIYCIDHSLVKSVIPGIADNKGYLLENMVFCRLRRLTEDIFYYKTKQGNEVDFYWLDVNNAPGLIQVSWDLFDENTRKREIRALCQAMGETKLESATIVTKNQSETVKVENKEIKVIPAWRFLISE